MELVTIFIIKMLDNILSTCKSIHVAKEQYLKGAIFNAISTFFYFIVIVQLAKESSLQSIIAVCVASFIGTYLSGTMVRKSEGDRLYIFRITSTTLEDGISFADSIRDNNIAIRTTVCYDNSMDKTLFCEVYCNTKEESRKVRDLIPKEFKYHVQNPIE